MLGAGMGVGGTPGLELQGCCRPALRYLIGVRGLLLRRRGERSLGWKEKPSLMLSSTDGATYVKPWGEAGVRHYPQASPRALGPLRTLPRQGDRLDAPAGPGPHQEGLVRALAEG